MGVDFAEETERPGLVATFGAFAGQREAPLAKPTGIAEPAGKDAQI